jgi:hypothetical protein
MAKDSRKGTPRVRISARINSARAMMIQRTAKRRGYQAVKIRRYDASAPDWNRWKVTDADHQPVAELHRTVNGVLVGPTTEELEKFLGITSPDETAEQEQEEGENASNLRG